MSAMRRESLHQSSDHNELEKANTELKKAGLDALLVWKDENQRYLTDLRPQIIHGKSTCLNGALLIENEDPILFALVAKEIELIEQCHGLKKSILSQ